MKKIVIFEDSLENTVSYVKELSGMDNVEVSCILLYCRSKETALAKIQEMRNEFPENTEIRPVTLWDYERELDAYYAEPQTVFLFDMNLIGDGSTMFENRINVLYAKKRQKSPKEQENPKLPRIWFYTTTKAEQRAILLEKFDYCTLSVKSIGKQGVELDFRGNERFMKCLEEGDV